MGGSSKLTIKWFSYDPVVPRVPEYHQPYRHHQYPVLHARTHQDPWRTIHNFMILVFILCRTNIPWFILNENSLGQFECWRKYKNKSPCVGEPDQVVWLTQISINLITLFLSLNEISHYYETPCKSSWIWSNIFDAKIWVWSP